MLKGNHPTSLLKKCLDDLEARIDPQVEDRLIKEWVEFSDGRFKGAIFSPLRERQIPAQFIWPEVSVNAALDSFENMALQQYGACSRLLEQGSGALLNIRCNFGTGIMPSLFGLPIFIMEESYNTLPTSRPVNDLRLIKQLLDKGIPDLRAGYGGKVFDMAEYFLDLAKGYPKIGQYVYLYHPDLQGPMDICELIWGSSLFISLYDHPELVKALLELVTETYIQYMRRWIELVPFRENGNIHWGLFHKGNLMLRDDSAMNLSAAMFTEFIQPYDQRLLNQFGGGAIHFCGRGDHYLGELSRMKGVYAVHLTQPEYNDMETVFANTIDRGIHLLDLKREYADTALANGRNLHGRVHAW